MKLGPQRETYLIWFGLGGAVKPGEEEDYLTNQSMLTLFVEIPLALPGSAKK